MGTFFALDKTSPPSPSLKSLPMGTLIDQHDRKTNNKNYAPRTIEVDDNCTTQPTLVPRKVCRANIQGRHRGIQVIRKRTALLPTWRLRKYREWHYLDSSNAASHARGRQSVTSAGPPRTYTSDDSSHSRIPARRLMTRRVDHTSDHVCVTTERIAMFE